MTSICSFVCCLWVCMWLAEMEIRNNATRRIEIKSNKVGRGSAKEGRKTVKRGCVPLCVLIQPVKVMSSLFLLGAVPGLASCQPSGEPNDSFDPIRISAKSTLCSLRACTRQLTTRPPSMPTLRAKQPCPVSGSFTCQRWVNASPCREHFAESALSQHTQYLMFKHIFLFWVKKMIIMMLLVGVTNTHLVTYAPMSFFLCHLHYAKILLYFYGKRGLLQCSLHYQN